MQLLEERLRLLYIYFPTKHKYLACNTYAKAEYQSNVIYQLFIKFTTVLF